MQRTVLRVTTHWLLYSVAKVSCLLLSLHTFWVVLSVCLGSRGPKLKKNNFWRSCCHHLLEKLLRQQAGIAGWAASSDGSNLVPRSYQDKKPVLLALELSSPQPTVELDVRKKRWWSWYRIELKPIQSNSSPTSTIEYTLTPEGLLKSSGIAPPRSYLDKTPPVNANYVHHERAKTRADDLLSNHLCGQQTNYGHYRTQ